MCGHCVIESVKRRMLSRRQFLSAAPAAAAATAIGAAATVAPSPAQAAGFVGVEDLTHAYDDSFPTYFGAPGISQNQRFNFDEHGFNLNEIVLNEHTGTHLDAPLHFSASGASVDAIPVTDLVAPLAVIDIRVKAANDDEAQVTPEDIAAWKAANGDFPERCCVAMLSGWDEHTTSEKYRNVDAEGKMRFPGFHIEATQMLLEETSAVGMAVDTLSLDVGSSATFETHYAWLPTGRWGLENVANLGALPANGATIVVGAPTHKGGSGGPSRVLALI